MGVKNHSNQFIGNLKNSTLLSHQHLQSRQLLRLEDTRSSIWTPWDPLRLQLSALPSKVTTLKKARQRKLSF